MSDSSPQKTSLELIAAVDAYNARCPDFPATGAAREYRMVHIVKWKGRAKRKSPYLFRQRATGIEVKLKTYPRDQGLAERLKACDGKPVASEHLAFRNGGLIAKFRISTPPETIAQAMLDLIDLTLPVLNEHVGW